MKKTLTLFSSFLFFSLATQAQNLVLNPSFEQYDTCPNNISQIYRATNWDIARDSPDYFNACSSDTFSNGQLIVSVPSNGFGFRTAASGNAYSGVISKWQSSEAREIIRGQLITPLQVGLTYYASFKVSLAGQANPSQFCGINKLGILFSTIPYNSTNPVPICNCAQVFSDSIVTDTLSWTRLTGSFTADSSYSYINIGRLFSNALIDTIQVAGSGCNAYYYIDDVCVSTDSEFVYNYIYTGIVDLSNQNISVNYYPNPVSDFITIVDKESAFKEVKIYTSLGQTIKTFQVGNLQQCVFDLSYLSKGIYHLQIIRRNLKTINASIIKL